MGIHRPTVEPRSAQFETVDRGSGTHHEIPHDIFTLRIADMDKICELDSWGSACVGQEGRGRGGCGRWDMCGLVRSSKRPRESV